MFGMHSNNLVGPKPIVIPLKMHIDQKKIGYHPYNPVIVRTDKNGDTARMMVGMYEDDMGGKRHLSEMDGYRCIGVIAEGYDPVSSTHAFAGRVTGAIMQGSADAARVQQGADTPGSEINRAWAILEDLVADFDDTPVNIAGKNFYYLGLRKYDAAKDSPRDVVGKAMSGKNVGDRTAPVFINRTL